MPELLPPIPEENDDGGLLDEAPRPMERDDPPLPPPEVTLPRGTSNMSTSEPEPQPTPQLQAAAPPTSAASSSLTAPSSLTPMTSVPTSIFHDLDLLDGYAPVRERGRAVEPETPYMSEAVLYGIPPLTETVRMARLKRMNSNGEEEYEADVDEDESDDCFFVSPADAFLTGKATRSEVRLKDLSQEDRQEFIKSMAMGEVQRRGKANSTTNRGPPQGREDHWHEVGSHRQEL